MAIHRYFSPLFIALVLTAPCGAGPEGGETAVQLTAADVLEKARRGTAAFHTLSYRLRQAAYDQQGKELAPPEEISTMSARVWFERTAPATPPKESVEAVAPSNFRVRAEGGAFLSSADPSPDAKFIYDGEQVRVLHPPSKTVSWLKVSSDAAGEFWGLAESWVLPSELVDPAAYVASAGDSVDRYVGDEEVDGVACHVLEREFRVMKCFPTGMGLAEVKEHLSQQGLVMDGESAAPKNEPEHASDDPVSENDLVCYPVRVVQRVSIGRDDGIARKIAHLQSLPPAPPSQERVSLWGAMIISDVRVDAEFAADTFQLATPAGFTEQQIMVCGLMPENLPMLTEAADWTLKDSNGKEHRLSDYRGKFVLLDFWGTWCAPCVGALPEMAAIHKKFGAQLVVLGLSCDDYGDPAGVMKEKGCEYACLLEAGPVARKYGVQGFPTFVLIGPRGEVLHAQTGVNERELGRAIEAALKAR